MQCLDWTVRTLLTDYDVGEDCGDYRAAFTSVEEGLYLSVSPESLCSNYICIDFSFKCCH